MLPLVWMVVDVVWFIAATGVAPQFVKVLITQISLISDPFAVVDLTVTVLRAVPFCVALMGFVDASGVATFVLSLGVVLQTLICCPINSLSQSQSGFALLRSSKVQPSFSAIL